MASSAQIRVVLRCTCTGRLRTTRNFYISTSANNNLQLQRLLARSLASQSSSGAARISTSTTSLPTDSGENLTSSTNDAELHSAQNITTSSSAAKAYAELAKAKLSALVVTTTACGFLAAGGPFSAGLFSSCIIGTALCSSSAAAMNQIIEVDRDKRMKRTQQRPLVQERLTVGQAKAAAALWGVGGVSLLAAGTDPVTTFLGASNIVLYAGVYTFMKPRSIYNTWVGAVVGAIPPVMGWTAATGGGLLDIEAVILGSTLYLWQMPHFFALSFMYRHDYSRGGFAMVPCLEEDGEKTAGIILRNAVYLSAVPFAATLSGVTSSMFALEGVALNAYALHVAHKFYRERTNANARKIFLTSLWYLPSFMMLFLLHSKVWDKEENTQKDAVHQFISDHVHAIREAGRQLCLHEKAIDPNLLEASKQACPIVIGSKTSQEGLDIVASKATEVKVNALLIHHEVSPET